jgi:hypothetical protein
VEGEGEPVGDGEGEPVGDGEVEGDRDLEGVRDGEVVVLGVGRSAPVLMRAMGGMASVTGVPPGPVPRSAWAEEGRGTREKPVVEYPVYQPYIWGTSGEKRKRATAQPAPSWAGSRTSPRRAYREEGPWLRRVLP